MNARSRLNSLSMESKKLFGLEVPFVAYNRGPEGELVPAFAYLASYDWRFEEVGIAGEYVKELSSGVMELCRMKFEILMLVELVE